MVQPQLEIIKNTNKIISMIQSSAAFAHNVANNPMLQLAKSSGISRLRNLHLRKEVIIMSGVYRTAQICKNGHVITSNTNNTAHLSNFCPECKAETISACPECNTPIRGKYDVSGVMGISSYTPPKYCHHCGHPFPWTESTLNSISELLDMQNQLTEDEKQHFMSYLPIIFDETPQSEVTALKLRLLFNKLPSEIGSLAKNVITDVISESIKKILFP